MKLPKGLLYQESVFIFYFFYNTSVSQLCNVCDQGEDPFLARSAHALPHAFTEDLAVFSKT